MAEANQFGLSTLTQLADGRGWYAYSGQISSTTNAKPVILVQNTGQMDAVVTITFGGAVATADLNAGTVSNIQVVIGGEILYQNKLSSIDGGNPNNLEFSLFLPKNSTFRINVTDSDTTGKHTTMVRAMYL